MIGVADKEEIQDGQQEHEGWGGGKGTGWEGLSRGGGGGKDLKCRNWEWFGWDAAAKGWEKASNGAFWGPF